MLLVTLDSCRYDTFATAHVPNMTAVGPLRRALAPGTFTYSSHAAMFVGFTPDVPGALEPYVNPKYARLFMLRGGGSRSPHKPFVNLRGRDIVDGFNDLGYDTIGTGAMMWFNPGTGASRTLIRSFQQFHYPDDSAALDRQLEIHPWGARPRHSPGVHLHQHRRDPRSLLARRRGVGQGLESVSDVR